MGRPALHFLLTILFWLLWAVIVYFLSRWLVVSYPSIGDVLGVLGTLLLFLPTLQALVWDLLERVKPLGRENPLSGHDHDPFTVIKLIIQVTGIGLIGLGFAINYWAKSGL